METIKCTLIGDEEIGKTCMLTAYVSEIKAFTPEVYIPTVIESYSHLVKIDGSQIRLEFFDTSGKEFYDRLIPLCYENTNVFLICFSLMNSESLRNVELKWHPEAIKQCPSAKIILVGTKLDIRNEVSSLKKIKMKRAKMITNFEGLEMAKKICALQYFECSALTRVGLEEVFEAAAKSCFKPRTKASEE